jgi:heme exporter protein A
MLGHNPRPARWDVPVNDSSISLEISEVGLNRGGRELFGGLSLSLHAGELALLMGPNGSGKTSLLRAIAGFGPASRGSIVIRETGARSKGPPAVYLGHLDGLKKDLSVQENITFISDLHDSSHAVEEIIAELGLAPVATRSVRQLSAGQKRRVALAVLRASAARLWLLDEPLTNLDRPGRELLGRWLDAHLAAGGIAIAATHRAEELRRPGCLVLEL